MKLLPGILACVTLWACLVSAVRADGTEDCYSDDNERRIRGCTLLIEGGGQATEGLSTAYAMRGLAHSVQGRYEIAIRDYDASIALNPDFAVALNNRAWAYFRWGKATDGLPDVRRSLALNPTNAHALDTRAHIHQALGDARAALDDYGLAMNFGGVPMIKLYQSGLAQRHLYRGEIDGIRRPELAEALAACISDKSCNPLPDGHE
jgi:tetratricopeptide (TPR) repeat protein